MLRRSIPTGVAADAPMRRCADAPMRRCPDVPMSRIMRVCRGDPPGVGGLMKIEHAAYQVGDPVRVADWYVRHLGMTLKRAQDVAPFGRFLADDGDSVMLEFYYNPAVALPDYANIDPLVLHLAFTTDEIATTRERLIAAGATAVGDITTSPLGDRLAMLRDPWGFAVQLVTRAAPMI
jgi:catechol 2,3-dioxygenase-like lactoylglutathione lyase family enzyme